MSIAVHTHVSASSTWHRACRIQPPRRRHRCAEWRRMSPVDAFDKGPRASGATTRRPFHPPLLLNSVYYQVSTSPCAHMGAPNGFPNIFLLHLRAGHKRTFWKISSTAVLPLFCRRSAIFPFKPLRRRRRRRRSSSRSRSHHGGRRSHHAQPQGRGRPPRPGPPPQHQRRPRPAGRPQDQPRAPRHHQDVRRAAARAGSEGRRAAGADGTRAGSTRVRPHFGRLVSGSGDIKTTKDGKVLLSEMVRRRLHDARLAEGAGERGR